MVKSVQLLSLLPQVLRVDIAIQKGLAFVNARGEWRLLPLWLELLGVLERAGLGGRADWRLDRNLRIDYDGSLGVTFCVFDAFILR